MNEMNAPDRESIGAPDTSRFHQLSAGKSGNGPGSVPPSVAVAATATVAAITIAPAAARRTSGVRIGMSQPKQLESHR